MVRAVCVGNLSACSELRVGRNADRDHPLCVCRFVSREAFSIVALFTPFLLSTIDYEKHLWGLSVAASLLPAVLRGRRLPAFRAPAAHRCSRAGGIRRHRLHVFVCSGIVCSLVIAGMFSLFKAGRALRETSQLLDLCRFPDLCPKPDRKTAFDSPTLRATTGSSD